MSDDTMRAMLLHELGGRTSPARVPRPRPGPGEAVVQVKACGVGLMVVNTLKGWIRGQTEKLPIIPGHEVTGVVADIGPGVQGVRPGDRVTDYGYWNCGACRLCERGREPLCPNLRGFPGMTVDGGYAEYFLVPAANLLPLPDEISFVDGTVIPDAVTTSYHVTSDRAEVEPGDVVAVIGAAGEVPFAPRLLVNQEATLIGSRYASKYEMARAIELVRNGKVRPVISEVTTLENVEALHDQLRAGTFFGRGAIVLEENGRD